MIHFDFTVDDIDADSVGDAREKLNSIIKKFTEDCDEYYKWNREVRKPIIDKAYECETSEERYAMIDKINAERKEPNYWDYCNINLIGTYFLRGDIMTEDEFVHYNQLEIRQ